MRNLHGAAHQPRGTTNNPVIAAEGVGKPGMPQEPGAVVAPVVLSPIPQGGGRLIIDKHGDRTVITTASLPPEVMQLANMAEETAFGLLGLLVVIVILGPFARMIARRMENRPQTLATGDSARVLQQQLLQLQQSMDAMSVEVERISESQRFQSKLLHERREV